MKRLLTIAALKKRLVQSFFILLFLSFSTSLLATHFRYGNISWSRDGINPNRINFKVTMAWRRGFNYQQYAVTNPPPPNIFPGTVLNFGTFFPLEFGDGATTPTILTVTSISIADDWFIGEFNTSHVYAPGNYLAFFQGAARISPPLLQNNGDGSFRVETRVTVGNNNDAPVSTLPPIINMVVGLPAAHYQIPATDPDGDPLVFSLAPPPSFTQTGMPLNTQPNLFTVSPAGLISFNTIGRVVGRYYNAVIRISDDNNSYVHLDVLIKITNASAAPEFDYSVTPPDLFTYNVTPGTPVSFVVKASDPDPADNTTLFSNGVPIGASMTPPLPFSGLANSPVQSVFNWTPTLGQVGSYVTTFIAQDPQGVQTPTTVKINVACNTTFTASASNANCTSNGSITLTATNGQPPYSFSINGGATYIPDVSGSHTFTNLGAGSYAVSVRSSNGCVSNGSATVGEDPDTEAPVINCPGNVQVNNDPNTCGALVNYLLPKVNDNCGNCSVAPINGFTYLGSYEGHKYYLSNAALTWPQAKTAAEAAGGHLGTIGTAGENDFINANASMYSSSFWIGGFQNPANPSFSEPGGGWEWVDGTPFTYTNWAFNEPNQFFGPVPPEDHIQFYSGIGQWNDLNEFPLPYLLELDCTIQPQLVSGLPSGSVFPVGNTTVTYKATDASGNNSTCSFVVTVTDNTAPTISCTPDIVRNNTPGACKTAVNVPAPALADNCNVVCNTDNIDEYKEGNISGQSPQWVTWPGGQSALVSTEQSFSAPNSMKVTGLPTGGPTDQLFLLGDWTAGSWILSFRLFVPTGNTAYYNLQHFEAPGVQWAHQVQFNSNGVGRLNAAGVITSFVYPQNTWVDVRQVINQTTDQSQLFINGVLVGTWQFSRQHTGAAGANRIGSLDFYPVTNYFGLDPNPAAIPLFYVDDISLCGNTTDMGTYISRRYSKDYPVGTTPVHVVVSDPAGNTAQCNFNIVVNDTEAPVVLCKPLTVTLENGVASITAAQMDNGSTDNCGIKSRELSKSVFTCSDIGMNTVTLTVTDIHNNVSTCSSTVTVVGEVPTCSISSIPSNNTYTGGVPTNLYLGYGPQSTTLMVTVPATGAPYTYSWSGGPLSNYNTNAPVFAPTSEGVYTFTVLVTNKFGCTTTCSITICVLDVQVTGTAGKKIVVCHKPNGANPHSISISVNAVAAHLAHGDALGDCSQTPCSNSITQSRGVQTQTLPFEAFRVVASPNPTQANFTLWIKSSESTPVSIRVIDQLGREVLRLQGILPDQQIRFGEKFIPGTYVAEIVQGKNRHTVKLLKL